MTIFRRKKKLRSSELQEQCYDGWSKEFVYEFSKHLPDWRLVEGENHCILVVRTVDSLTLEINPDDTYSCTIMQKNLPIYLGGSILYKAYGNKRIFSAKNPFDVATYIKDHIADYESEFNLRVLEAKGDELQEKQRRNIADPLCDISSLFFL